MACSQELQAAPAATEEAAPAAAAGDGDPWRTCIERRLDEASDGIQMLEWETQANSLRQQSLLTRVQRLEEDAVPGRGDMISFQITEDGQWALPLAGKEATRVKIVHGHVESNKILFH